MGYHLYSVTDHFDDVEPQREWNQKKMPPEKSPKPPGFVASQSNTTDNNDAIAGTVNALKAMFNDKPVVASKPGAKKVFVVIWIIIYISQLRFLLL